MIAASSLLVIVALSDFLHSRGLAAPALDDGGDHTPVLPVGHWRRALLATVTVFLLVLVALSSPWWALLGVIGGALVWMLTYRARYRPGAMAIVALIVIVLLAPAIVFAVPIGGTNFWLTYHWALLAVAITGINMTTANRVVRMMLRLAGASEEHRLRGNHPRAGRVIGVLERYLLIALIVAGQGVSIAGVAAAKSLIRYPEISKSARDGGGLSAEVFFVGTVTSWLIALASAGLVALAVK